MYRYGPLLVALLLAGCDEYEDTDTDTDEFIEVEPCPDGLAKASTAGVTVTSLLVGGVGQVTAFEQGEEYDGYGASACVDDDATEARWILISGNEPFLSITIAADASGSYDANGSEATLTMEVLSGTQAGTVVANGDYTTNNWFVDEAGTNQLSSSFNGTANGGQFQISFVAEASP